MLSVALSLLLSASPQATAPSPGASPESPATGPVILFLIDNSASLPPLDPSERRVTALEKMFGFLKGQRYRLILFGGRREISVDDVSRYRNEGRWTDFYHAFLRTKEIAAEYPKGTDLRMVLLTDAIPDPDPADWPDVPRGWEPKSYSIRRSIELLGEMELPLYVVLVGDAPPEDAAARGEERSPGFVLDMVRAANGRKAAPLAQTLAAFFADDGLLLRRFVYRVRPEEGLQKLEPIVKRIASPPRPGIELRIFVYVLLPLLLALFVLLGLLVRSFPGPGDLEILELALEQPLHVAVDKLHRSPAGQWSAQGLSLVGDPRLAAATFTLQQPALDLTGSDIDPAEADPKDLRLLPLGLDELRSALESATDSGAREDKIHALNLDYAARSLQPAEAERVLLRSGVERRRTSVVEFVRAKAHLAFDPDLERRLLEPRLAVVSYGKDGERRELAVGDTVRLGRYRFRVQQLERGGRRHSRLALYYDRVPSLLALKTILPDAFQRVFRFRRRSERIVS
jgi:hypothetical protein